MPTFTGQIIILYLLLSLAVIAVFILFIRAIKGRRRPRRERSEMSFVVDTFHELVAKLKEKERELEVLRRKAEERAEDVESYSDNIIQSVPSGVVSLDNDLRITKMNTAAALFLRCRPEDVIGKPYSEVFRSPLKEAVEKRERIERAEYLYEGVSGERRWIGLTTSPLKNRQGDVIGRILVFTDLTELKSLENQIRLRQWLSSIGEISLGIAHELRNPMAVISGYARLLSKKGGSGPEVEAILKEIRVMDRIITDFLSFARPITPGIQEIRIKELIEKTAQSLLKEREDIELQIQLEDHVIRSDEVLLRQAFSNLLRNGIEAMPGGGTLKVTGGPEGEHFIVNITDTGRGIAEEIRDKVFLPFYTTREKGTGLGLSVVQKNITLLGGSIHFESSGGGTTFSVKLPLNP